MSARPVSDSPGDPFARAYAYTLPGENGSHLGRNPYFMAFDAIRGARARIDDRWYLMAGSSDYRDLATHPGVLRAAKQAVSEWGTSSSGTRWLNGNSQPLNHLEQTLAAYLGKEAAAIFPSGFAANASVIAQLVNHDDIVIIDRAAHASIYEGCYIALGQMLRSTPQRLRRFSHNNLADLERVLRGCPPHVGKLVITEGIFSMTGDIAPIAGLASLCHNYGARTLVDEAHAIGVLGDGCGATAANRATDQIDLLTGSFSKALAAQGGFLAGDAAIVLPLKYTASELIFSAAIVPAATAAAAAALEIVCSDPAGARTLIDSSNRLAQAIQTLGYHVGIGGTPIIPLFFPSEMHMFACWQALMDKGIYTNAIVNPAVPAGTGLLRISNTAALTPNHHDKILRALRSAQRLLHA